MKTTKTITLFAAVLLAVATSFAAQVTVFAAVTWLQLAF